MSDRLLTARATEGEHRVNTGIYHIPRYHGEVCRHAFLFFWGVPLRTWERARQHVRQGGAFVLPFRVIDEASHSIGPEARTAISVIARVGADFGESLPLAKFRSGEAAPEPLYLPTCFNKAMVYRYYLEDVWSGVQQVRC